MLPSFHLPGMEPKPLRPCDIRVFVQNALIGFEARQAIRKAIRERKRKRDAQRPKAKIITGVPIMKSGITFRATFEQPIGPRNPAGLKLTFPIALEVFEKGVNEWRVRRPGTRTEFEYIAAQSTPETVKRQLVGIHFERQLTDWEVFDSDGKLQADEWATDPKGKPYVTELRRTRLAEKDIHERAERARQKTETYERDFKQQ
jgi:hypothetical protein